MPGALTWDPQTFPHQGQHCGWISPCGSRTAAGHTSQKTIRDLWGALFVIPRSQRVHSRPEGNMVRSWVERERECGCRALTLLGSKGGMSGVLQASSLWTNVKHKCGN